MGKPEWGNKCLCQACGTKYYDMKKSPATCPNCSEIHVPPPTKTLPTRVSRPKPAAPKAKVEPPPPPPPPPSMDDDDETEKKPDAPDEDLAKGIEAAGADDDEEDEPIEDASELGEDKDDMAEVLETKPEKVPADR